MRTIGVFVVAFALGQGLAGLLDSISAIPTVSAHFIGGGLFGIVMEYLNQKGE